MHPCPCCHFVTDNAPTYVARAVAAYPPSHSPCHCRCRLPAVAFTSPLLSPPTAQLIFSHRRTLPPSSPLPSQIICSRWRIHTAAAVAFTSLLSSPPTAQLIISCQRPHIVSTVPFTCGHPRINPNAFYSHPTRSFIKKIPKKLLRMHQSTPPLCVYISQSAQMQ